MSSNDREKRRAMNAKFDPIINIKVIGVGGGGGNAVERMVNDGIRGVQFIAANTDLQQLQRQNVKTLLLGENVTSGLGAGGRPTTGEEAALDSEDEIKEALDGAHMVFVTAGLGGGTGTGAAPVIARIAKEEVGALTIAVVTLPFEFEQPKRNANAIEGLNELKKCCDGVVIVSNQRLYEALGDIPTAQAFDEADNVLRQFVQSVSDIITSSAMINIDFADIRNVLKDSGVVLFGIGIEDINDVEEDVNLLVAKTLKNPLLLSNITNAGGVILNVTTGVDITPKVHNYISKQVHNHITNNKKSDVHFYWGLNINEQLEPNEVILTIIGSNYREEIDLGDGQHTISAKFEDNDDYDDTSDYDDTEETIGTIRSGYRETTKVYDEDEIFGTTTIQRRPSSSKSRTTSRTSITPRRTSTTTRTSRTSDIQRPRGIFGRRKTSTSSTGSYIRRKK